MFTGIGSAVGKGIGTAMGIAMLGLMEVDFNSDITFWISTGMAIGGDISLVNFMIKNMTRESIVPLLTMFILQN